MSIAFRDLPVYDLTGATRNFEQLVALKVGGSLEGTLDEPTLVKGAGVGAWTNPEAFSAKTEEHTTLQVRTEQSKAVGRLKGFFKAKEAIPAKTALFTLPVGFRPPALVKEWAMDITAGTVLLIEITTGGVVESPSEITIAHFINFDGITFQLT